jgi:hemolysin activation/secretion protein
MRGWWAGSALHVYQTSLPAQTLAASVTFEAASEQQGLQPQFTLGEDNGLRGYPAREFSGSRRFKINLEDRIDTGLEVWTLRFGVVVFYDIGWAYDAGQSLALANGFSAAGVGLRFGSSNLLGPTVVRIDVAWPLRNRPGVEDYGMSVSLGVNQVFGFFGARSDLRSDFSF